MVNDRKAVKKDRKIAQMDRDKLKTDHKELYKTVQQRLVVLACVIVALMMVLIVRLYQVQILNQQSYTSKLASYISRNRKVTTPRGEVYDSNGNILVTNRQVVNIVYYPAAGTTNTDKWEMAQKFAQLFDVSDSLGVRDTKDCFIYLYPEEANKKITDEEWSKYHAGGYSLNDIYNLRVARVTEEDTARLTSEDKKAYNVYSSMNSASVSQAAVVYEDVNFEEASYFLEHINDFRGFDVNIDWAREYPYGSTLRNVLGSITTSKSGLPSENANLYLAMDYSRNEKVGRSGLELEYEELLAGQRAIYNVRYNEDGLATLEEVESGSKGYDLRVSLDVDLQSKIEEVILREMQAAEGNQYRLYWDTTYYVMMEPETGNVLALVGVKRSEDGTYYMDPVSTYTESLVVGSAVKGATVYMGLDTGVISRGEYIYDTPIKIKDTPLKSSHANLGWISDIDALAQSSNVYMMHIAMRIGGANYEYDKALRINSDAFDIMRNYYSQFGLGVSTGIDLPNEGKGYAGTNALAGNLLDYAIGQYSTYTPIQLVTYISTIANGGKLMQPRVLLEAYESGTRNMVYQNPVTVLNTLDNTKAVEEVQKGFKACVYDPKGLCKSHLSTLPVTVAAKTGTAQNTLVEDSSISSPNNTIVAYAPIDKPKVAVACAAVNAWNEKSQANICQKMTGEILEYYFAEKGY